MKALNNSICMKAACRISKVEGSRKWGGMRHKGQHTQGDKSLGLDAGTFTCSSPRHPSHHVKNPFWSLP